MSAIRIITALLLAVVLAVGAVAGFWYLALQYAEQTLASQLEHQLGATITYGKPKWVPALDQMDVQLPNVDISLVPPGSHAALHLKMPVIELVSSFFDQDRRLVIRLPGVIDVQWQEAGRQDDYLWLSERTEMTLLQQEQGVTLLLHAPTNRLVLGTDPHGALMLQFTEGFLGWFPETQDGQPGRRLEMGLKQVATALGKQDDFYFSGTFTPAPDLGVPVVRLLHERNAAAWQALLTQLNIWLEQGGKLTITHALTRGPGYELAAYGEVAADVHNQPVGELTLTAANADWLVALLRRSGLLSDTPTGKDSFQRSDALNLLQTLQASAGQPTARLMLHQGRAVISGTPAGVINTYPQMLRHW